MVSSNDGFKIHCADENEVVKVSNKQASKMQDVCYFRTIFQHGTVESHTRTIEKADWTSAIQLVVTTGNVGVGDLSELKELSYAAGRRLGPY
jgi:hypothetical protein